MAEMARKWYVRIPVDGCFTKTVAVDSRAEAVAVAVEGFINALDSGYAGETVKIIIQTSID